MKKVQGILAWSLPILVVFAFVIHAWISGGSRNLLIAGAMLTGVSAYLGVFLNKRSHGQEGKFVTVRIGPKDDKAMQELTDFASIVCAGVLVVTAVVLPYL